jgi:hypothetical protein
VRQIKDANIPRINSKISPVQTAFLASESFPSALNLAENLVMADVMPKSMKPIKKLGTKIAREYSP